MRLVYPQNCVTEASRLSFCYRAQELLRQDHNRMGEKYRAGEMTPEEWSSYRDLFERKSSAVISALIAARQDAWEGKFWSIDLERDIADV